MSTEDIPEAIVAIEIWVAGHDAGEALTRRDEVIRSMDGPSVEHIGAGLGRFFYDLWRANNGEDPLAGEGAVIADAEFHLLARAMTDHQLDVLTASIIGDLEQSLGFRVAVHVSRLDPEFDATMDDVEEFFGWPERLGAVPRTM